MKDSTVGLVGVCYKPSENTSFQSWVTSIEVFNSSGGEGSLKPQSTAMESQIGKADQNF